jgi:5-methylcytosine-specific restriction protein A
MNRKQFILSQGATCKNWLWSWSFVNHEDKIVLFGAWDVHTSGNTSLILSEGWKLNDHGRKSASYDQSREHIRLIEEEDYLLKTFPIEFSNENQDEHGLGPSKLKSFKPIAVFKNLLRVGENWYASDNELLNSLPEEISNEESYIEGAKTTISVNIYERNTEVRKVCLEHFGYQCQVCKFNFEETYGNIGKNYIHVHHLIPLSEIGEEYQVAPKEDLRPVCPNCHAMLHKTKPALTIEQLRRHIQETSETS